MHAFGLSVATVLAEPGLEPRLTHVEALDIVESLISASHPMTHPIVLLLQKYIDVAQLTKPACADVCKKY